MYSVGSIIVVKNHIFSDRNKDDYQLDHAKKRPAIVILEDEESFYYLTITSNKGQKYGRFEITSNGKSSYVSIETIYEKPIYGAIERGHVSEKTLLNLLIKLYSFQDKNNYFVDNKVQKLLLEKIKDLTKKLEGSNSLHHKK